MQRLAVQKGIGLKSKLWKWLTWSSIDAVGRLLALLVGTTVLSRLLAPKELGLGALVLIFVIVASVFVGAPFEEALAQRKVLRRAHVATVVAFSWFVAGILTLASIPAGHLMAWAFGQPEIVWLLPIASLSIVLSGQGDILTGVARRLRRFNAISIATLIGNVIGVVLAILVAAFGYGVWALVVQRVATTAARTIILHERLRLWIKPSWNIDKFRDLERYARISLFDRLSDNVNHLAFNAVVASMYGLAALGYVNMAIRVVEPIRALVGIAAHNIGFSHFAAAQDDADDLMKRLQSTISLSSLFIVPIFAGLAAVTPDLLPVLAGPGWEPAIPICVCLAIGSALALPARLVFSALSAKGRPEFSLLANGMGVVATLGVLFGSTAFGPISVGVARIAGDAAQALVAILVLPKGFEWRRLARLSMLSKAWLLSACMAAFVATLSFGLGGMPAIPRLILCVIAGGCIYAALLLIFVPSQVRSLNRVLTRAPAALGPQH